MIVAMDIASSPVTSRGPSREPIPDRRPGPPRDRSIRRRRTVHDGDAARSGARFAGGGATMDSVFSKLGLTAPFAHAVEKMGYTEPTPIQCRPSRWCSRAAT